MTKADQERLDVGELKQTRQQKKRSQIFQAGKEMLIDDGAALLTMRRLAEKLQMSLGNLQYYFPTRDELFQALIEHLCIDYQERMGDHLDKRRDPTERLTALADFMVSDFRTVEGSIVFWELWALSAHNKPIADAVNHLHELERQAIEQLIRAIAPKLSRSEIQGRAIAIASMFEGVGLYVGVGRPLEKNHKSVARHLKAAALAIAMRD